MNLVYKEYVGERVAPLRSDVLMLTLAEKDRVKEYNTHKELYSSFVQPTAASFTVQLGG